jgi:hypothetical protein
MDLLFVVAVPFLDFALELIAAAVDDIQIVVGELAPLLLYFASNLLPVSFNAVPVHFDLHEGAELSQISISMSAVPWQ